MVRSELRQLLTTLTGIRLLCCGNTASSKGIRFDANFKMMRVPTQLSSVVDAFDLGVNYAGIQVNDHRIELYLLDCNGRIAHKFLRLQAILKS